MYSRQRLQGEKSRERRNKKIMKELKELKAKLAKEKRKGEKYKKRYQRMKREAPSVSPQSKVRELVRGQKVRSPIKRALLFHTTLVENIRQKYRNAKTEKERQLIARVTSGSILKKYKLQKYTQKAFGYSKKRNATLSVDLCATIKRKESDAALEIKRKVRSFYLRDDVSRMTPGCKQTITRQKKKMQKRLLTDTLKNLHRKFLSEQHGQLSYSTFCRLRPFWVITPTEADRNTCLCKTHENTQLMANVLHSRGILSTKSIEDMADSIMCDSKGKACAYSECRECLLNAYQTLKQPGEAEVCVAQWTTERIHKEDKSSMITVKRDLVTTESDLVSQFQERLSRFKQHIFNIRWQYTAYRQIRETLKADECMLHIDFSENYLCKYSQEIQAVHFGGSHQQATLHTGVLYTAEDQSPLAFCSISPSRRHDPTAIWAHLDPVLGMIRQRFPEVKKLHFFSDGPATQYRQKGNFYLLSTEPYKLGFENINWNYFEAGHGKGAPDGVGGALKR